MFLIFNPTISYPESISIFHSFNLLVEDETSKCNHQDAAIESMVPNKISEILQTRVLSVPSI